MQTKAVLHYRNVYTVLVKEADGDVQCNRTRTVHLFINIFTGKERTCYPGMSCKKPLAVFN